MKQAGDIDQPNRTRRTVLRRGAIGALGIATGVSVSSSQAAAGYDHELKVETDGGDGEFWCYIYWNGPNDYETENVEYDDFHEDYEDLLKLELLVNTGYFAPGYDIVRWNGGYEMYVQKYDDTVDAYFDGELITTDEGDTFTF